MKMIQWVGQVLVAALFLLGTPVEAGERGLSLDVMMIRAQDESVPLDRRLEKVEYKLRRVFNFPFYRFEGQGGITLPEWGEGFINLPGNYRVWIRRNSGNKAEISWFRGDQVLLSTAVGISRGSPVVLGGMPANGGKLILVVTPR